MGSGSDSGPPLEPRLAGQERLEIFFPSGFRARARQTYPPKWFDADPGAGNFPVAVDISRLASPDHSGYGAGTTRKDAQGQPVGSVIYQRNCFGFRIKGNQRQHRAEYFLAGYLRLPRPLGIDFQNKRSQAILLVPSAAQLIQQDLTFLARALSFGEDPFPGGGIDDWIDYRSWIVSGTNRQTVGRRYQPPG